MRFTLAWLKHYLDTDAALEKIAHTLTMTGLEIEDIDDKSKDLKDFEVAEIIDAQQHPDADKLLVSKVEVGDEVRQIVSGISKFYSPEDMVGKKVVVVTNLKPAKLRGVMSEGMILAAGDGKKSLSVVEIEDSINTGEEVC